MNNSVIGKNIRSLQETVEFQRKQIQDLHILVNNADKQIAAVRGELTVVMTQTTILTQRLGAGPTA